MGVINNIFAFIVAISVLVAIHEYGHFIVARWCGIKVLRYSIGFGKPIYTRQKTPNDTEYCISALPLGGYVKLLDEREGSVAPEDMSRTFNAQPVWQRIAVLLAGPAFNFIFAVIAYWVIFVYGVSVTRPVIGEVTPMSVASQAGLSYGDVILRIGDSDVESWQDGLQVLVDELVDDARIPLRIERTDGSQANVVIETDRETSRLSEPGKLFENLGFMPWSPRAVVGEVVDASPANIAGLRSGDSITAVDGVAVSTWSEMTGLVSTRPGERLALSVVRGGEPIELTITPRRVTSDGREVGQIGIRFGGEVPANLYTRRTLSISSALPAAVEKTGDLIVFTLEMFGRMVTGSVSLKNISGPINIAEFAGMSLNRGFSDFLDFLALISVSLGVLNLLPIPMLDGGQIVYQAIEGVSGRPLSERMQILGQQIGIVLLLGVMSIAFYNDIARVVGRMFS